MKYSLRSMMIGITLICVLVGGRLEYLRRWEAFHTTEFIRHLKTKHRSVEAAGPDAIAAMQHGAPAVRFHDAVFQPWTMVDTTPREILAYDRDILADDIVNEDVDKYIELIKLEPEEPED